MYISLLFILFTKHTDDVLQREGLSDKKEAVKEKTCFDEFV